jgi:hypothetical protein
VLRFWSPAPGARARFGLRLALGTQAGSHEADGAVLESDTGGSCRSDEVYAAVLEPGTGCTGTIWIETSTGHSGWES